MINNKYLKDVFKLDPVTSLLKLTIIPAFIIGSINILFFNISIIQIVIPIIFLLVLYFTRIYYLSIKFKSYIIVYAKITKVKKSASTNGLVNLFYQYEFDNNRYISNSRVLNLIGNANSSLIGGLIKIIINVNNPIKNKVVSLK